jgi:uncharacterized oligopeptide transporter (OPT) family protein
VRVLDPASRAFVPTWTSASDWGMTLDHGAVLVGAGAIVGLRTSLAMVIG